MLLHAGGGAHAHLEDAAGVLHDLHEASDAVVHLGLVGGGFYPELRGFHANLGEGLQDQVTVRVAGDGAHGLGQGLGLEQGEGGDLDAGVQLEQEGLEPAHQGRGAREGEDGLPVEEPGAGGQGVYLHLPGQGGPPGAAHVVAAVPEEGAQLRRVPDLGQEALHHGAHVEGQVVGTAAAVGVVEGLLAEGPAGSRHGELVAVGSEEVLGHLVTMVWFMVDVTLIALVTSGVAPIEPGVTVGDTARAPTGAAYLCQAAVALMLRAPTWMAS